MKPLQPKFEKIIPKPEKVLRGAGVSVIKSDKTISIKTR